MFNYIGYDLKNDTLIATNSETEWALTLGHIPQQCEYFKTVEEALKWLSKHPNAHQEYLKELEREYQYFCGPADHELNDLIFLKEQDVL